MRNPTGTVAIDTVPLPESPIRFELFFLDHLADIEAISPELDIDLRTRLSLVAIGTWPTPEYPEDELVATLAGVIIDDGRQLVIDSLEANGHIPHNSHRRWLAAVEGSTLASCLPGLLRDAKVKGWTDSATIDLLETTFAGVAGMGYVIEGSPMDEYCRRNPHDPRCHVMSGAFMTMDERLIAQDVLIVRELYRNELLTLPQTRAILNTFFLAITPTRRWADLPVRSAGMILDSLDIEAMQRNKIRRMFTHGGAARYGPDSPWADICSGSNPPRICLYLHGLPVAAAFTLGLVQAKVWEIEDAFMAWDSLMDMKH